MLCHLCVGHTAWAPKGREGRNQEARRASTYGAPRLLVTNIISLIMNRNFSRDLCLSVEKDASRNWKSWESIIRLRKSNFSFNNRGSRNRRRKTGWRSRLRMRHPVCKQVLIHPLSFFFCCCYYLSNHYYRCCLLQTMSRSLCLHVILSLSTFRWPVPPRWI